MTPSSLRTPANSVSSTTCILNVVRRRFVTTVSLAALVVGAASLIAPDMSAAPPPVTVTQPVQVQVVNTAAQPAQVQVVNPVQVQGTVQVEGVVDVLKGPAKLPYIKEMSIPISEYQEAVVLRFAIPTGKRLVTETITLEATAPVGQTIQAQLLIVGVVIGGETGTATLSTSLQGTSPTGKAVFAATHPITLRIDSSRSELVARISRYPLPGEGHAMVSIFGYLEDL